jgi:hypothetical protein
MAHSESILVGHVTASPAVKGDVDIGVARGLSRAFDCRERRRLFSTLRLMYSQRFYIRRSRYDDNF